MNRVLQKKKITQLLVDMENIVEQIINQFDFAYMLAVNILTYIVIKVVDTFNGAAKVPLLQKRIIFILAVIVVTIIYFIFDYSNRIILVNSAIAAPVSWSWIFKPLFDKFGIGYKHNDK